MDQRRTSTTGQSPPPPCAEPPAADLGSSLRALFEFIEAAPVPDEISRLVVDLEKKRARRRPRDH